jgi:ABC-2 type transport system permease protein
MQAPAAVGWIAGAFVIGVVFGAFTDDISDAIAANPAMAAFFPDPGDANSSYIGLSLTLLALMAIGVVGQTLTRIRAEESGGALEPILARSVSRVGWSSAQFGTGAVAALLTLLAGGTGLELTAGGTVDGILTATFAYLPAVLVIVGVACVLFGFVPRWAAVVWLVLGYVAFVAFLGETIDLPDWALYLSPLHAVGDVPLDAISTTTEWMLLGVFAALTVVGLAGFRRRDVPK